MTQSIAAFYDLDRTLITANSALLYTQFERRHGRISLRQYMIAAAWMGLYHLNVLDIERAYRKAIAIYKGMQESEIRQRAEEFFLDEVHDHLLPGAKDSLAFHRQENHHLVLATNGSSYQADIACRTWKLDHWLANGFPIDETGRLEGTFEDPLCFGSGKLARAAAYAKQHGIHLKDCYFYSDSFSDLPMLQGVGHPRVVNPDPKLRRYARQKGWQILDWREA